MVRVVHNSGVDEGTSYDDDQSYWDESTEYNSSNVSVTSSVSSSESMKDDRLMEVEIDTDSEIEANYEEAHPYVATRRSYQTTGARIQITGASRAERNVINQKENASTVGAELPRRRHRKVNDKRTKENKQTDYNDIGMDNEEKANRQTNSIAIGIVIFGALVCAMVLVGFFFNPFATSEELPTPNPTLEPSTEPSTSEPTSTIPPTESPTTAAPTWNPTFRPSVAPSTTLVPSSKPTLTPVPTSSPSTSPTNIPTITSAPTPQPPPTISISPSNFPSASPSDEPSPVPTSEPSSPPTGSPSSLPTASPTLDPTSPPTLFPTSNPTPISAETWLEAFISSIALREGEEFKNPEAYQSKALAWLETDLSIEAGRESFTDDEIVQRYALACIWFATNGVFNLYADEDEISDGWWNTENWLNGFTECTWYGISCDNMNRVNKIDLRENNITGTFPDEVTLLADSLVSLDIGYNNVHNRNEETDFLGKLTNLAILDVGETYFEYAGIPPALGNLTNLEVLDISYTYFYGPIRGPEVFANLQKLQILEMGGNEYNQEIPSELARLPALSNFYCDNAGLTGGLDFVELMPVIFELWIDANPNLGGSIPTSIGSKFATLESLSLTENGLTGRIPNEMGNLRYMQALWLYDNSLTGTIPSAMDQLEYMYEFDISNNQLQGIIPNGICQLANENFGVLEYLCVDCEEVRCCCCSCCATSTCRN